MKILDPKDLPNISSDKDLGVGILTKGLSKPTNPCYESCRRAMDIAIAISGMDAPKRDEALNSAWKAALVQGTAGKSITALTLWLARGREVHINSKGQVHTDPRRRRVVKAPELSVLISKAEKAVGIAKPTA